VAPGQFDPIVELSYAQNSLGSVLLDSGDLAGAARQFRASLDLKQQALLLQPQGLTLKAEWADSLSWLGTALLWQGEFKQAQQLFAEGLRGVVAVREAAPKDLLWIEREAMMRTWLGRAWQRLGLPVQGRAELGAARKLLGELLVQEPKNRKWLSQIARAVSNMGREPFESSSNYLQRLRRIEQELLALDSGASASAALSRLPDRAQVSLALAGELQAQHRGDEALHVLKAMSAELRKGLEQRGNDLKLQTGNAQLGLALADLHLKRGDIQAARQLCAKVRDELLDLRPLLRVHFEITEAWVAAYSCLGQPEQAQREQAWLAQRSTAKP
jgi:hypothetical protein